MAAAQPGNGRTNPCASPHPSFDEIYRAYFERVSRWTRALGGPAAEREDLVQDVFVVVHRRLPDFDGRNVDGWLYQITRRRVRDFRRRHWMRLFLSGSLVDELLISTARGPERELLGKEQETVLLRLLSKLSESQRTAFVLFEIDGYSGEEIARLEDVRINTVWARIRKAREKLAAHLTRLDRQR